jgi:Zn-dependent protease
MGDSTAKRQGRLSLNPIKHIDPFGTVLLPLMLALLHLPVFGYAKPVPYNPNNFKDLKKGELLTGLAGPAANLIMALASALIATILLLVVPEVNEALNWAYNILFYFALINLYLMFFNLIPIPPLDGSSIIAVFLSRRALETYYRIQQYSLPILMIILVVLPMVLHFNPLGVYMNATAGNIANLLFPGAL